jgi:hypothetical protein
MDEYISNFIVDAQYRIAELTVEIDEKKRSDDNWKIQYLLRLELSMWLSVLYESVQDIYNGYNFLSDWTETEIKAECERLRLKAGITRIPYLSFTAYAPEIVVQGVSSGGSGVPAGTQGQLITYDASNVPYVDDEPEIGGMGSLTISQYFS